MFVYLLYFTSTYFCECQVFENFEFLNLSSKEKESWIKRYSAMFLSRSMEEQPGHNLYWFIIDLLLIVSKNLAELILFMFFSIILWNMSFLHI